jgi:dimethylamine monooxygenase subunit B
VKTGTLLTISHPVNLFPIDHRGRKHILLAGGIGITPIIAMAEQLARQDSPFELHYCVRSAERGAYVDDLRAKYGPRSYIYRDDAGQKVPLAELLDRQPLGTHLYICGPPGMIEFALTTAHAAGWPDENVHVERFLPPPTGDAFKVHLARSGRTITVGEHESILEALEAAGVDAPYLCRGGACGQCETAVVSAQGELLHNDHYLTPEEHLCGQKIMVCVSRFKGQELIVDL